MSANSTNRYGMKTTANLTAALICVCLAGSALALVPKLSKGQLKEFGSLMNKGMAQLSAGDLKGAEQSYKKLMLIYAGNDTAVYNLACTYARAEKKDLALATLRKAIALGFTDVAHMKKDPDLDSIRTMEGFEAVLDHATELEAQHGRDDPLASPVTPAKPFESLAAIEEHYRKEAKESRRLRSVLGSYDRESYQFKALREQLSAFAAYGAAHPEEKKTVAIASLKAMEVAPYGTKTIRKAIEKFKSDYAGDSSMANALTLEARLDAGALYRQKKFGEGQQAQVAAAKEIVKRFPDADGSRDAYFWLYEDASENGREDEAQTLYKKLKERFADDGEFWRRHGYEFFAARVREEGVPDFSVTGTNGETMSRQAAKGKVTLIDFWATWCGPCRAEIPHLKAAYEKYHSEGFEIYGISGDKRKNMKKAEFVDWVKEHKMPWPEFYEGEQDENRLIEKFGIFGFPTTLLLARDGSVAAVNLRGEELEEKVAALVSAQ